MSMQVLSLPTQFVPGRGDPVPPVPGTHTCKHEAPIPVCPRVWENTCVSPFTTWQGSCSLGGWGDRGHKPEWGGRAGPAGVGERPEEWERGGSRRALHKQVKKQPQLLTGSTRADRLCGTECSCHTQVGGPLPQRWSAQ